MNVDIQKHIGYYICLVFIGALGLFLISQTAYDKKLQMVIVVFTALFYSGWGILHHCLHHDLHIKIVVEYVLIGCLGMIIALFFLRGGQL